MNNMTIVSKITTCIRLLESVRKNIKRATPESPFYDLLSVIMDKEILRLECVSKLTSMQVTDQTEFNRILDMLGFKNSDGLHQTHPTP